MNFQLETALKRPIRSPPPAASATGGRKIKFKNGSPQSGQNAGQTVSLNPPMPTGA